MKKIYAILLCVVLLLTACTYEDIEICDLIKEYMESINVVDSELASINYEKISKYSNEKGCRDLTYISSIIDEMLLPFYEVNTVEDRVIMAGDMVLVCIEVEDKSGEFVHKDDNVKIQTGVDYYGTLEESLIGRRKNDTLVVPADEKMCKILQAEKESTLFVTVLDIFEYTPIDETEEFLEHNEFKNYEEYYVYLADMKMGEHDYEKNSAISEEFFKYAISACRFTISESDVKNHARHIVDEMNKTAASLGISIEEYYTSLLSLDEDGFYLMCTEMAEKEIQKNLVIGALSAKYKIEYSKEKYDAMVEGRDVENLDSETVFSLKYLCLEEAVVNRYVERY